MEAAARQTGRRQGNSAIPDLDGYRLHAYAIFDRRAHQRYPGSEISGIPASESYATVAPVSSFAIYSVLRSISLCS